MELSTFLILIVILVILFAISLMIHETKYRIAFYMIIALGFLSILNVYLTISYYVVLRNDPGVPGDIGPKGPKGVKGNPGKCTFSEECGIMDARKKILNIASSMYDIENDCLNNPTMDTCKEADKLEQALPINSQINMLEQIAYQTKMSEKDFMDKLKICLTDAEKCNESVDF